MSDDMPKNQLLSRLAQEDLEALRPHLRRSAMKARDMLQGAHEPITEFLFPESGFVSLVNGDRDQLEVGLVGSEGMVGVQGFLVSGSSSSFAAMCQYDGSILTVAADAFGEVAAARPALADLVNRYANSLMAQLAFTAAANVNFTVDQRLARWLLMAHDRLDRDELHLTHDFLAMMLGVRRPGVTVATHVLEGLHLIRATRGSIKIVDRAGLKLFADGGHGGAEAQYARLFPPDAATGTVSVAAT